MLWCFDIENQKIQIVKGVYIRYMCESLCFPILLENNAFFSQFEGETALFFPIEPVQVPFPKR